MSEAQLNKVQALIQAGIDEGAMQQAGGGVGQPGGAQSWMVREPTVFADANPRHDHHARGNFGPVGDDAL